MTNAYAFIIFRRLFVPELAALFTPHAFLGLIRLEQPPPPLFDNYFFYNYARQVSLDGHACKPPVTAGDDAFHAGSTTRPLGALDKTPGRPDDDSPAGCL